LLLFANEPVVLESGASLGLVDLVFTHPQCSTTGVRPERRTPLMLAQIGRDGPKAR
jgi:hypothetical protein